MLQILTLNSFIGFSSGFIVVLISSIWVFYDSGERKISIDGKPYGVNNGQWAWLLSCILLWIASFPWYVYKRSRAIPAAPQYRNSIEDQLRRYKQMLKEELISQEDYEKKKNELLNPGQ